MNSLTRCRTVIDGHIPDRVPVALHNFLPAAFQSQYPMSKVLQDGELIALSQLRAWKEFQHDMLLVENGVIAEAGACGCEIEFYDDGPPRVSKHILADRLEGVYDLVIPDPYTTFPMNEVIKAVKILVNEIGDEVFIMGRSDQGPGALAMALRGYERFILDLAQNENPELIRRLIEYCIQVQIKFAQALRESGAHGTAIGGLGISLLSPSLYRSLEKPAEWQVIHAVSNSDFPVALHICGNATLILDDMVSTGCPVIELDDRTDLGIAKNKTSSSTTILGPVSPELIRNAQNPDMIMYAAQKAIDILAPQGGFILGAGCALAHDTPSGNIQALVKSAEIFGRYSQDGKLKDHRL